MATIGQHVSASTVKLTKFRDGGLPMCLTDLFCITTRYRDFLIFKLVVDRHHGFLKLKILKCVHFKDNFNISILHHCIPRSYHCKNIAIFVFFG